MDPVHSDFELGFRDGIQLVDGDGNLHSIKLTGLGDLEIASGAIGLGDAFTGLARALPPSGAIPKGRYGVELSLLRYETDAECSRGDVRVAAARVKLSDEPVSNWVRADVGAGVDSGTCAFVDADFDSEWEPSESESETLLRAMESDSASLGPSASAVHQRLGARSVFAFSSGIGDGIYAAYWGMTQSAEPAMFCLDFELLLCPIQVDIPVDWPLSRGALKSEQLEALSVKASVPLLKPGRLEVQYDATKFPIARWKMPDGSQRHIPGQFLDRRRLLFDFRERPDRAELLLRVVTGRRPMREAGTAA